jgi:hypothetical protein
MQLRVPWLKPAVWGAITGSTLTVILGFSWMGWVAGGTAERMAVERANAAVVVALTPSCVTRFMQQPDVARKARGVSGHRLVEAAGLHGGGWLVDFDRWHGPELGRRRCVRRAAPQSQDLAESGSLTVARR